MSVTIDTLTLSNLQAQPLGYETTEVKGGLTAREWQIQGIVTGQEWLDLLAIYDTWRDAKILEEPAEKTKLQGTTVAFSGTGYGGQTWSSIPCWFSAAPSGTQVGAYVSAGFTLVDAAQAIEVIVKSEIDSETGNESGIDYGTITLGGVVITLTADPDEFVNTPTLELTAAGKHYVSGPLTAVYGKNIEGTIVGTDKNALRAWYVNTVQSHPVSGSYFPTNSPSFNAIYKLVDGLPVLYYEVTLTVTQVL